MKAKTGHWLRFKVDVNEASRNCNVLFAAALLFQVQLSLSVMKESSDVSRLASSVIALPDGSFVPGGRTWFLCPQKLFVRVYGHSSSYSRILCLPKEPLYCTTSVFFVAHLICERTAITIWSTMAWFLGLRKRSAVCAGRHSSLLFSVLCYRPRGQGQGPQYEIIRHNAFVLQNFFRQASHAHIHIAVYCCFFAVLFSLFCAALCE